ncbi:hypothetical protein PGT21_033681 [Puccinia graminis f. sp. tritici]|uniref:Uncharacterized protein n=1 Tax=Puccinia graminis f. sp. tritici TaxID=56615 RepID=A0A5B0SMN8_PUCGR|nr:hypothetical protein PGT21_033681 [Puccinia graminis f. sp. tritici]KAA1139067.1 hypothetical protein PGTUg99_035285 [Puccinia graminis f. sp. tritici]
MRTEACEDTESINLRLSYGQAIHDSLPVVRLKIVPPELFLREEYRNAREARHRLRLRQ